MKTLVVSASFGCALLLGGLFLFLGKSLRASSDPASSASLTARIEQGRYLVHELGMCIDCHSPRGPDGQFVPGRDLQGAAIGFEPLVEMPWANVAPGLAGLPPGYTEEDTIQFLMTGVRPHGAPPPRPPMPQYHLTRSDAEAVTAYLVTLRPAFAAD